MVNAKGTCSCIPHNGFRFWHVLDTCQNSQWQRCVKTVWTIQCLSNHTLAAQTHTATHTGTQKPKSSKPKAIKHESNSRAAMQNPRVTQAEEQPCMHMTAEAGLCCSSKCTSGSCANISKHMHARPTSHFLLHLRL